MRTNRTIFNPYRTLTGRWCKTCIMLVAGFLLSIGTYAQVAVRGSSNNTGTTTSLAINKPGGTNTGDLMVAVITHSLSSGTAAAATSSGWTLISGASLAGNTSRYGTVLYKVATSSDASTSSYTFTLTTNTNNAVGAIVSYSGVDANSPFDVAPGSLNVPGTASATATATGITTVRPGDGIVMATMAAGTYTWSGWTSTATGAMTETVDKQATANASVGLAFGTQSTAGATGNGTATASTSSRAGAIMLALKRPASITSGSLSTTAFTTTYGTASTAQSLTIGGSYLTGTLTATAPTGFEVSSDGFTWASTATWTPSAGAISGTLYIRLAATAAVSGTYNSVNIALTSSGATTVNIATPSSGNTVNRATITITAGNQSIVYGTAVATVTGAGTYTPTGFVNSETSSVISGSVTYTTTYTTTTASGTSGVTITPVVTGLTAANYSFTAANGTITINKSNSTISATGATTYTYTGTPQGPNTSTVTGSTGAVTYSYSGTGSTTYGPSATRPTNSGTYQVTATVAADANFNSASSTAYAFTINKAVLTITAGNQSVTYGTPFATVTGAGSYTPSGFLNGETSAVISGTVSYTTSYTISTGVGTSGVTITPVVTGLSSANYNFTAAVGTITINKASSSISASGTSAFTFNGSAQGPASSSVTGSTGSVTYSYSGTGATTYGPSATAPSNAGTYQVVANVAADANYNSASSSAYAFTISKANSSVSVSGPSSFTYNGLAQGPSSSTTAGSSGAVTYSYSGTGSTTYGPSATAPTSAGTYQVLSNLAGDANYNSSTSTAFAFTINKAALSITAINQSKVYGNTQSTPVAGSTAFSTVGLQNGETIGSITLNYGAGALTATAAAGSTSTITPSAATGGSFSIANYTITYNPGTLTVTKASLTITANNQIVAYGTAPSIVTGAGSYTASGFVNGETASLITGSAIYTSTYTATTNSGTAGLTITPIVTGLNATNYSFIASSGTITINKAVLTISANGQAVCYGTAVGTVTGAGSYGASGFMNSETSSVIGGSATYTTTYTSTTLAGSTGITITPVVANLTATNYTFTAVSGIITVNALPVVAAITGTNSVCIGATTTLSSTTPGGTWSSSNTAVATVNGSTGVVTGVTSGIVTISYAVMNANNCTSVQTTSVTVNATPASITISGGGTVCNTTTLVASGGTGGTIYFQGTTSGGTSTSLGGSSQLITTSGTYYFRSLSASGCWGPEANATVTRQAPVTNSVTICQGTTSVAMTTSTVCGVLNGVATGVVLAGAGATDGGAGNSWSNAGRVTANDGSYASSNVNSTSNSEGLNATNFGFSIPSTATITGITVNIDRYASNPASIQDRSVYLMKAGSTTGSNLGATATDWPTSGAIATYGSSSNLWGTTWTASDINDANFGVKLNVDNNNANSRTANVDYISVTVTYNDNGIINWYTAASGGSPIGSGTSFNPVGVTGSGLANTNTAGTTTYYAECSSNPGCRAASDYIITASPTIGGSTTLCAGSSTTLTGSGTAAASTPWASSNSSVATISPSGVVTAITAGTTTITYTTSNGCTVTATLTVNPLTTISSQSTGAQSKCVGGAFAALSVTATGTSVTYQWYSNSTASNSGGTAISGATSSSFTPSSATAGTVYYYCIVSGSCNMVNSTVSGAIITNTLPVLTTITGATTICAGSSSILSSTPTGGSWSSSNTSVASVNATTGQVTGLASGTTTITYTFTNVSGCSSTITTLVTVNTPVTISVEPSASSQVSCINGSFNALTVTATGTGIGYQWYSNTTNSNSGGTIIVGATTNTYTPSASAIGTTYYYVVVSGSCGNLASSVSGACTVTATPSAPTITTDYCGQAGAVILTASGGYNAYLWSTGQASQADTVDLAGTYTVIGYNAAGCASAPASIGIATELVTNGGFESGNIGFTSDYIVDQTALGLQSGGPTTGGGEGEYAVQTSGQYTHNNFWGLDRRNPGTGKIMLINGATTAAPYTIVWHQTGITIAPNTTYYFSAFALSLNNASPFGRLQFMINGVQVGSIAELTAGVNSNANNDWSRFYGMWNSGSSTTVDLQIVDLQTAAGGNDFGLDDISFSTLSPVALMANPSSSAGASVCQGTAVTLSANVAGGKSPYIYNWSGPNNFSSTSANPTINAIAFAGSGTYTVTVSDALGCNTATGSVTINVTGVVTAGATVCVGGTGNLTSSSSCSNITTTSGPVAPTVGANTTGVGSVAWTNPTNITGTGSTTISNMLGLGTTSNYLTGTNYGFNIPANATIQGITASFSRQSSGSTSPLIRDYRVVLIKGGTIQNGSGQNKAATSTDWPNAGITAASYGGAADLWNNSWTPSDINTNSFGVALSVINQNPFGTRTATVENMTITVTYSIPGTIQWFTVSSGGTAIGSGSPFNPVGVANSGLANTNTPGTYTFYAECSTNPGCRTATSFVINALPTVTGTTPAGICGSGSSILSGTASTGATLDWYAAASGGTALATGTTSFSTPGISSTTTYYAEARNIITGCVSSSRTAVTATVTTPPNAGTLSGTQAICSNGSTTFSSNGNSGGTWTSSNTAIATVNASSGAITAVSAGTATITYTVTGTGGCTNATATRTITVTAAPNAGTLSGTQAICANGSTTFSTNGNSGGTWTSNNTGVATVNASTGVIAAVGAGTATITYTVTGIGGCTNATATRTVTVTAAPNAGTLSGTQAICSNGSTTFSSNGNSGGTWTSSNTAIATVNASSGLVTAVSAGTATITYTVTGTGGCTNATATRTVTVTAAPNAGTLSGTQSICSNGSTTFSTNGNSGGTWTSNNTGVATVNASSGAITAVGLGTATITYTVTGTGGCSNAASTRTVTVNALPATPTISGTLTTYTGLTTQLTGNPAGGTWISSQPSVASVNASGLVTGVTFGTITITYTYTNVSGCSSSATASVIINAGNVWQGTLSSDWNTAGNWSMNTVPNTSGDNAVITSGTLHDPILNSAISVRNLILQGSSVTSLNNYTLSIYGTVSGTGMLRGSSASVLNFAGSADQGSLALDQTTDGSTNALKTLTMSGSGSFTLGSKIHIFDAVQPNAGTMNLNGVSLVLHSDAKNTARIDPVIGVLSGATNVTAERYITSYGNRAYRLLTPIVSTSTSINANWQEGKSNISEAANIPAAQAGYGTHITGLNGHLNGFDESGSNEPSLFAYDPVTQDWATIDNTNKTLLDAMKGYLLYVRGNRDDLSTLTSSDPVLGPSSLTTLRATGTVRQGDQTFIGLPGDGRFSLVTNPYAAPIDWSKVYSRPANSKNFEDYLTYVDPNVSEYGGFVTINAAGIIAPAGTNAGLNIQSGVAFFVRSKPGVSNPTLLIQEYDKGTINNLDVFKPFRGMTGVEGMQPNETARNASGLATLSVSMYYHDANGRRLADGVVGVFDDRYSASIDHDDADEINNWGENMAINRDSHHLSIESRPTIQAKDTLPLFISNMGMQDYELDLRGNNLPNGLRAWLVDNYTKTSTPLDVTTKNTVKFTTGPDDASMDSARFLIVFEQSALPPPPDPKPSVVTLTARTVTDGIQVAWTTQTETLMDRFILERSADSTSFTQVATVRSAGTTASPSNYGWFDADPLDGANWYRVKSLSSNGEFVYSNIARADHMKGRPEILLFPNPVRGTTFNLKWTNVAKGPYRIVLTDMFGHTVWQDEIEHDGKNTITRQHLSYSLAKGMYNAHMSGKSVNLNWKVIVE